MKIFLDTANIKEIEHILKWGIIEGVTTNQKIFLNEKGVNFEDRVLDICQKLSPLPVSVESNGKSLNEIVEDCRNFAKIAQNVVPKVPMMSDGTGLEAVNILAKEGIPTNMTVMMNFNQLMLAAKAGATYVSLFYNRAIDSGEDPKKTILNFESWKNKNQYAAKLIVGSIRKPEDVEAIASAGADIITIPYKILTQMSHHKKTEETIKEFDQAWKDFTGK